jgi:hypothetical protein
MKLTTEDTENTEQATPETDDQPIIYAINDNGYQVPCVDLEFARRLERERDEARRDLEFRRKLYKVQEELWDVTRRQRDEALDQVEELTAVIKGLRAIMRQDATK